MKYEMKLVSVCKCFTIAMEELVQSWGDSTEPVPWGPYERGSGGQLTPPRHFTLGKTDS